MKIEWTTEAPVEAGWYWCKLDELDGPEIVLVTIRDGEPWGSDMNCSHCWPWHTTEGAERSLHRIEVPE